MDFLEFQAIVLLVALLLVSGFVNAADENAWTWPRGKSMRMRQEWGR